jgi:hypothetical protein
MDLPIIILGWAGLGAGCLAFLWFILGNARSWLPRRERPRRCPKCWYDLSHTPGMRCSECGFEARHEKRLHRVRRRWILVPLALAMVSGGWVARGAPHIRERGWVAAVPSTAIILALPLLRIDPVAVSEHLLSSFAIPGGSTTQVPPSYWQDAIVCDFVFHRVMHDRLWKWQELMLESTCDSMQDNPAVYRWERLEYEVMASLRTRAGHVPAWSDPRAEDMRYTVVTRPTWPVGAPIFAVIRAAAASRGDMSYMVEGAPVTSGLAEIEFDGFWGFVCGGVGHWPRPEIWTDDLTPLGRIDSPCRNPKMELIAFEEQSATGCWFVRRFVEFDREIVELPFQVEGGADDILLPRASPEFENALRDGAQCAISRLYGSVDDSWGFRFGVLESEMTEIMRPLQGAPFAFRVSILHEGDVVARGEAWFAASTDREYTREYVIPLEVLNQKAIRSQVGEADPSLTVSIEGHPYVALRNFSAHSYWSGEVTLPIVEVSDQVHEWSDDQLRWMTE